MSIKNLLYSSYWFSQPRLATHAVLWLWIGFFLVLVLACLVLLFLQRTQQDKALRLVFSRFSSCTLAMGIVGLIWFYFRQERVLILGWRFWLVLWVAIFGVWLFKIIRYTVKRIPQIKAENKERELREKYLPKKK